MEIKCWNEFIPPRGLVRHVRQVLTYVDQEDLGKLDHILLLEKVPEISIRRDPDLRSVIEDDRLVFGAYKPRDAKIAAHIILIVRSLYDPIPPILTMTPAMTLRVAEIIGHEIAHHLIAERKFTLRPKIGTSITEDEEEFARRYARALTSRMERRLIYRFGSLLLNAAARINFQRGARAWGKGEYETAVKFFDLAIQIKADSTDASYWFFKAREKVGLETRPPTI